MLIATATGIIPGYGVGNYHCLDVKHCSLVGIMKVLILNEHYVVRKAAASDAVHRMVHRKKTLLIVKG